MAYRCIMTRGGHRSQGVTCRVCFSGVKPVGTPCHKKIEHDEIFQMVISRVMEVAREGNARHYEIHQAGGSTAGRFERLVLLTEHGEVVPHMDHQDEWQDMRLITAQLEKNGITDIRTKKYTR